MRAAVASVALLLVTACANGNGNAGLCLQLAEVQRFGDAEVIREELPAHESWYKVVAFRPDGSVARVILGGAGAGPGEFQLPIHMTATREGVSVLDYELSRATTFS